MPKISYFLGISIYMYHTDHNPPHIHAIYNEYAAMININTGEIIAGKLPKRVLKLVNEWREREIESLLKDWALALASKELFKIKPLI